MVAVGIRTLSISLSKICFGFTLAVRLDVMLQVWDNGRDQRGEGRFPSPRYKEHPLLIISSVHNN